MPEYKTFAQETRERVDNATTETVLENIVSSASAVVTSLYSTNTHLVGMKSLGFPFNEDDFEECKTSITHLVMAFEEFYRSSVMNLEAFRESLQQIQERDRVAH